MLSIAASLQVPALSLRAVVASYVLSLALGIRRTGVLKRLRSFIGFVAQVESGTR
ncbi:MAG: hypothetical protein ACI9M6_000181 [Hydrogenophaga sp.]